MTDILKAFLKAGRLSRRGRPLSAAFTLQEILVPRTKPKSRNGAKTKSPVRRKSAATRLRRPAPGSFTSDHFSCPHGELAYRLYTPIGSTRRRLPLVVMLHGCSQTAEDFALGTEMNRHADEHGILVLYPQQSQGNNLARCWNWHKAENQTRGQGEAAVIAALTRHALALTRGNPERVYIAGLSAGGAAAAIIAAAYPDLYVAVGVHSGVARGDIRSLATATSAMRGKAGPAPTGKLPRQAPTIVFQGDADRTVHPSNAAGFLTNLERSISGPLLSQASAGRSEKGRDFTRKLYKSPAGEILLEEWTVHGSGHGWSGGRATASYTDPAGPSASREMLRFFLTRRRTAKTSRKPRTTATV